MNKKRKQTIVLLLFIMCIAGNISLYLFQSLIDINYIINDWLRVKFTQNKKSDQIVYAMTSQDCLDQAVKHYNMGYPWKRSVYVKLINYLNNSGAKLIVFHSYFSEPSVYGNKDDAIFAKAIKKSGNIIIGSQLDKRISEAKHIDLERLSVKANSENTFPEFKSAILPTKTILDSTNHLGMLNAFIDEDNTFRQHYLLLSLDNKLYPSLSLSAYLALKNPKKLLIKDQKLFIDNNAIPINKNGLVNLKYYGDNNIYEDYFHFEMLQIYDYINWLYKKGNELGIQQDYKELFQSQKLKSYRKKVLEKSKPLKEPIGFSILDEAPPEAFKNKIVFVGSIAPGLYDISSTPFFPEEAGIHLEATFFNNLLNQDYLYNVENEVIYILSILMLSTLIYLTYTGLSKLKSFTIFIITPIAVLVVSILLYKVFGLLIQSAELYFTILSSYLLLVLVNHIYDYYQLKIFADTIESKNAEIVRLTTKIHNSLKNKLDTISESLTLLNNRRNDTSFVDERLYQIQNLTHHCSSEAKNMLFIIQNNECEPLELIQEIELRNELTFDYYDISCDFDHKVNTENMISARISNYILDIYNELSRNIIKHSKSDSAYMKLLINEGYIYFEVQDNGTGFDYKKARAKQSSYGLGIIEKLSGEVKAEISFSHSIDSMGTKVEIKIPLQDYKG